VKVKVKMLKLNGIVFNKHGHVVVLMDKRIGKLMVNLKIHLIHVVLIVFVHNQQMVQCILNLVVINGLLIFSFDIQKHWVVFQYSSSLLKLLVLS